VTPIGIHNRLHLWASRSDGVRRGEKFSFPSKRLNVSIEDALVSGSAVGLAVTYYRSGSRNSSQRTCKAGNERRVGEQVM
jgi:hypothetical protein